MANSSNPPTNPCINRKRWSTVIAYTSVVFAWTIIGCEGNDAPPDADLTVIAEDVADAPPPEKDGLAAETSKDSSPTDEEKRQFVRSVEPDVKAFCGDCHAMPQTFQ